MLLKDAGFNKYFNRKLPRSSNELTEEEMASRSPRYSGSGIAAGVSASPGNKLVVNWDDSYINFSDGARNRVQVGNIDNTKQYGIKIVDEKGNVRFESSDANEQLSMYDEDFVKLIQIDDDGFHGYDSSGDEQIKIDNDGFHGYDDLDNELIKIDGDGLHAYNTDENELIKVDAEGLHGYGTDGNELANIDSSGLSVYGTTGDAIQVYDEVGGTKYGKIGYDTSGDNTGMIYYAVGDTFITGTGDGTLYFPSGDIGFTTPGNIQFTGEIQTYYLGEWHTAVTQASFTDALGRVGIVINGLIVQLE